MIAMVAQNSTEMRTPGRIPAMNRRPTDCSDITPYTMNTTLGGISMPMLPPAATAPVPSSMLYP